MILPASLWQGLVTQDVGIRHSLWAWDQAHDEFRLKGSVQDSICSSVPPTTHQAREKASTGRTWTEWNGSSDTQSDRSESLNFALPANVDFTYPCVTFWLWPGTDDVISAGLRIFICNTEVMAPSCWQGVGQIRWKQALTTELAVYSKSSINVGYF